MRCWTRWPGRGPKRGWKYGDRQGSNGSSRLEGGQVDRVGRVVTVLEIITRHLGR